MNVNGAGVQLINPVVQMLEDLLKEAKAGTIVAIAGCYVNPQGGIGLMISGPARKSDLHTGCCIAADRIKYEMTQPQQQGPQLVRAMALPGMKS